MKELMAGIAAVTGRSATDEDLRQFTAYLDLFVRWNRVHRMTALDSPVAIVRELFLDSLLFLSVLPAGALSVVDLGAGAGIPGLPMRLAQPQIRMTLVESKRKRVSFLRTVCREMGLVDVELE
jgi:16S rRNA (guanine527-N7)-methyltransferase